MWYVATWLRSQNKLSWIILSMFTLNLQACVTKNYSIKCSFGLPSTKRGTFASNQIELNVSLFTTILPKARQFSSSWEGKRRRMSHWLGLMGIACMTRSGRTPNRLSYLLALVKWTSWKKVSKEDYFFSKRWFSLVLRFPRAEALAPQISCNRVHHDKVQE